MIDHTYESLNTIIHQSSEILLDEDFVALAVSLDKGEAVHCGLAINHNKNVQLFHFNFSEVQLVDINAETSTYFLTKLPIIKTDEVEAFLTKCELINESEPSFKWGFFYDGEMFDENNKIISKLDENERVTNCVFFCISVISGFLVSQYIDFKDWNPDRLAMAWYEKRFLYSYRNRFTEDQFKDFLSIVRRIPPDEYFSSASISELAITKDAIGKYLKSVRQILVERHKILTESSGSSGKN
jgi:hypothetical protein